jgi:hypothetical protein
MSKFEDELKHLLNRCSMENGSNTPDWILAKYMSTCLQAFETASNTRETWYGVHNRPGQSLLGDEDSGLRVQINE